LKEIWIKRGMEFDIENFDAETGKRIVIDKEDAENLKKKIVIHVKCGKKHIDKDKFATFNHQKHLCHYCNEYFYDNERAVGI